MKCPAKLCHGGVRTVGGGWAHMMMIVTIGGLLEDYGPLLEYRVD